MVSIGKLTAAGLWVGSVKADFAFIGNKQVWEATTPGPSYEGLTFTAKQANSTLSYGTLGVSGASLQYSTDGNTWTDYTIGDSITLTNIGNYVCFRAKTTNSSTGGTAFTATGDVKASGNPNSLLNKDFDTVTVTPGMDAFQYLFGSGISEIDFSCLETIYRYSFERIMKDSSVLSVDLSNVTTINMGGIDYAFQNCASLKSVRLNKYSGTGGGDFYYTFQGCSSLEVLDMSETTAVPRLYHIDAFANTNNTYKIVVPDALYSEWVATNNWSSPSIQPHIIKLSDYLPVPTKVKYTAASGLPDWEGDIVGEIAGGSGQATTQIPNVSYAISVEPGTKVTGIGNYAFYHCSNLSSVTITYKIGDIGSYAFDTCTGLNEITLSTGLSSIAATSFDNCSNLSSVTWESKNQEGVYYMTNYPWGLENGTTIHCSNGDLIVGQTPVHEEYGGLTITAREANSTVSMIQDSGAPSVTLEYSTDGNTWNPFVVGTTTVTLSNIGDKVYFRAGSNGNTTFTTMFTLNCNKFVMTGSVDLSGNLNSIINQDYDNVTTINANGSGGIGCLFYNCSAIVDASKLLMKATTIGNFTYNHTFYGCSNMTKAPTIYATSIGDRYSFGDLFNGCSSLSEIKIYYTGNFGGEKTSNWVNGVPATGTFYYNGSDTTRGASYVPDGWTITPFTDGGI